MPRLTISADNDGNAEIDSHSNMSGDELLDCAAGVIAGAVQAVEQVWLAAGKSPASARQAGQCAINRASILLNKCRSEMTSGKIETKG